MRSRAIIGARRGAGHLSSARGTRVIRKGRWGRVAAVTACLCLATTSAATAGSAHHSRAKAPVTLNMWWWGDQEASGLKGFVADSVKKFEAANPNIKIITKLQSTDRPRARVPGRRSCQEGPGHRVLLGRDQHARGRLGGQHQADLDAASEERVEALHQPGRGHLGRQALHGAVVHPAVVPGALSQGRAEERGHRRSADDLDQLLADCKTLRAKGITPIAGGVKDGWFGGWLYSLLGSQSVKSVDDVKAAVVGTQKFTDPDWPRGGPGSSR